MRSISTAAIDVHRSLESASSDVTPPLGAARAPSYNSATAVKATTHSFVGDQWRKISSSSGLAYIDITLLLHNGRGFGRLRPRFMPRFGASAVAQAAKQAFA